jgi:hypothetical protein
LDWRRCHEPKPSEPRHTSDRCVCAALLIQSSVVSTASAAHKRQPRRQTTPPAAQNSRDQLDSLVAPIALYPDPLLAQVLAASTYPLEIVQLQQWMAKNPELKGEALAAAVEKKTGIPPSRVSPACPTSSSASATTSSGRTISATPSSRNRVK